MEAGCLGQAARRAPHNVETLRKAFMDERTGGKFKIQIGYESFGRPKELLDLLKVGSLEMTNICASYHPEKLPVFSALDLPFLPIPDTEVQEKVPHGLLQAPAGGEGVGRLERHAVLCRRCCPTNEFVGRGKAPKTVEDFKGMRVRALAGIGAAMRKLGAIPTSVDATESTPRSSAARSMPRAFPATYAHQSYRTYEVGKWYTDEHGAGLGRLPDPDPCRSLGRAAAAVQGPADRGAAARPRRGQEGLCARPTRRTSRCSRRSSQFVTFSPDELAAFRKAGGEPVWEEWVKHAREPGHPGPRAPELPADPGRRRAEVCKSCGSSGGFAGCTGAARGRS